MSAANKTFHLAVVDERNPHRPIVVDDVNEGLRRPAETVILTGRRSPTSKIET